MASVKRRICSNQAPIYVRIPGHNGDIRCTLGEITKDLSNYNFFYIKESSWPFKITLRRYIVGRPNILFVPISILEN